MFRKGRRCLALVLAVATLALPAAPAVAAGRGDAGATWTLGSELWARLGEIGRWLHSTFLSDYTSHIDPNGLHTEPEEGSTPDHTSHIDPDG